MPRASFARRRLEKGVTLLHHRAAGWKTEVFKIIWAGPLAGDAAGLSLASYLLKHGHSRLAGRTKVSEFLQDLYDAGFSAYVSKAYGHRMLVARGSCVESRYLPGRVDPFKRLLSHARSVAERPHFARRAFPEETFTLERSNLIRAIDAIYDNKSQYSDTRLWTEMFAGHPAGIPSWGSREAVEASTPESVAVALEEMTTLAPITIYVVSGRETDAIAELVRDAFAPSARKTPRTKTPALPDPRRRVLRISESEDAAQSRLALGFRLTDYELQRDRYPLVLGDIILGGSSASRLFKNVREKRSLAYSIGSNTELSTGTLSVSAGIDAKNVEETLKLVRKEVKALSRPRSIGEGDMAIAMATLAKSLTGVRDSQEGMINFHMGHHFGGRKEAEPERVLKRYREVDPAEVAEAMGRARLDTAFILEGKEESR